MKKLIRIFLVLGFGLIYLFIYSWITNTNIRILIRHASKFSIGTEEVKPACKKGVEYKVPCIVHYIWFSRNGKEKMQFHHALSIISAYKFINPDKIHYHYDVLPLGKWWDYILKNIPNIVLIKTDRPKQVFGVPLRQIAHQSDIKRFEIMRKTGGIYLDNDRLPGAVGNGIIVSVKNATILNIWWDTYRNFTSNEWAYHACVIPAKLAKMYPDLIHVEIGTMNYPPWTSDGLRLLYDSVCDWSKNYCVHMWYRLRPYNYNPENIKTMNTTFGQMARYVFYGSKDIKN
ncbi:hypothetical protein KUTeg_018035 [Tegillarca granosa]|uniref:Uncharacterized protein n=1 Tax=Tegillarca granosa TaxID=220873 RepID=A0ABQ9ELI1_TEGGR|nr:hypothetical protein KUTeg_018035 [Tegillarca granosa]